VRDVHVVNVRIVQAQNELKIESELAKDNLWEHFFETQRAKATVQNWLKHVAETKNNPALPD